MSESKTSDLITLAEPIIYRVLTITNERNMLGSIHEVSTSAASYCTPLSEFWLTEDGLDEPNSSFVFITHIRPESQLFSSRKRDALVVFHYDSGEYIGRLNRRKQNINWLDDIFIHSTIDQISSLGNSYLDNPATPKINV